VIGTKLTTRIMTGFDQFATERQYGSSAADLVALRLTLVGADNQRADNMGHNSRRVHFMIAFPAHTEAARH
jgi:hypothetical protein